jgi:hypothetical protein
MLHIVGREVLAIVSEFENSGFAGSQKANNVHVGTDYIGIAQRMYCKRHRFALKNWSDIIRHPWVEVPGAVHIVARCTI